MRPFFCTSNHDLLTNQSVTSRFAVKLFLGAKHLTPQPMSLKTYQ